MIIAQKFHQLKEATEFEKEAPTATLRQIEKALNSNSM